MNKEALHIDFVLKQNASLNDTEQNLKRIVLDYSFQVSELAKEISGYNDKQTCYNIYDWVKSNIKYKRDKEGFEQLRRPARTIADGAGDCDCMTILVCALLKESNISCSVKIVGYTNKNEYQHIYTIAHTDNENFIIDTIPEVKNFNTELNDIIAEKTIKIFDKMELQELAGTMEYEQVEAMDAEIMESEKIDFKADVLSGTPENESIEDTESFEEYEESLLNSIVYSDEQLNGATAVTEKEFARKIIGIDLKKQEKALQNDKLNEGVLSQITDIDNEIQVIQNVINANELIEALQEASTKSDIFKQYYMGFLSELQNNGLSGYNDDETLVYLAKLSDQEAEAIASENGLSGVIAGRRIARNKLGGSRIKNFLKKTWNVVKKVSPVTVAFRGAALLIVKSNFQDIAEKLAIGYMTTAQAAAKDIDLKEHAKFVKSTKEFEYKWVKLGGNKATLKNTVKKTKAGKNYLNGLDGLAAALVLAKPIVDLIKNIFSNLSLKKLKKKKITPLPTPTPTPKPLPSNNTGKSITTSTTRNNTSSKTEKTHPEKQTFLQKAQVAAKENKKPLIIAIVVLAFFTVLAVVYKNKKDKTKKPLSGKKRTTRKTTTTTTTTNQAKPNTKIKRIHARAKAIHKQHPKMQYKTAFKKAAKELKK